MKTIDILVEELPKRGGWPDDSYGMCQSRLDCEIYTDSKLLPDFYVNERAEDSGTIVTREQYEVALTAKNGGWIEWDGGECPVPRGTLVDVKYLCGDVNSHIKAGEHGSSGSIDTAFAVRWSKFGVESDIIAYRLHKPQEAEQDKADLNECIGKDAAPVWNGEGAIPPVGCMCERSLAGDEWQPCKILFASNQLVVVKMKESGIEDAYSIGYVTFRPIRTEAERKRKEAIEEMLKIATIHTTKSMGLDLALNSIYNAIAAGEIPGVNLED